MQSTAATARPCTTAPRVFAKTQPCRHVQKKEARNNTRKQQILLFYDINKTDKERTQQYTQKLEIVFA